MPATARRCCPDDHTTFCPVTDLLPIATGRRTRAALRQLVKPHWPLATAAFTTLTAAAAVSLVTAPLLGRIVDLVVAGARADALTTPILLLVAVALGQGCLAAAGMALISRLCEQMLATLRVQFLGKALALPLERTNAADPVTSPPAAPTCPFERPAKLSFGEKPPGAV